MAGQMEILTREELEEAVLKRKPGERISFREREFEPMDLTGWDLSNMDFTLSSFQNVILNQVNFSGSSVENALFDGCSLHGADFRPSVIVIWESVILKEPISLARFWSMRI